MHKFNTTLTNRSDTAAQNQQDNTDADRVLPTDDGTQLARVYHLEDRILTD